MADNLYFNTSAADNLDALALENDPSVARPNNVKNDHLYKDTTSREVRVGTMPIILPESVKIDPDKIGNSVYAIPEGYHDGNGQVYTGSLEEYTPGDAIPEDVANNKVFWVKGKRCVGTLNLDKLNQIATAKSDDIVIDKTAWVNGKKVTGTIPKLPRKDKTLLCEESYTIPYGLSMGTSIITAASLESQTPGDATNNDISIGKTAWIRGKKVTGSLDINDEIRNKLSDTDTSQNDVLSNKKFYSAKYGKTVSGRMRNHSGEPAREINIGEEFYIPIGYYDGNTKIYTKTLEDATIGSARPEHIVDTKEAWVRGKKIVGTMKYIPSKEVHLDPGETFNILQGYHSGSGKVTAKPIEDATIGTAKDDEIVSGKTAWVNGKKIIGTMQQYDNYSTELVPGSSKYIPRGYHTGTSSVYVKSLKEFTNATAIPSSIINGKTAWVDGNQITGTMPINETINIDLNAGEVYNIPTGYHPESSTIKAIGLPLQTPGDAKSDDIVKGRTAWVDGNKVIGTMQLTASANAEDVLVGTTFYKDDPKNKVEGTLALTGNATEADVLNGVSFYNDDPKRKKIGSLILDGSSISDNVLAGTTFYNTDPKNKVIGTMPNIGQIRKKINLEEVFTIPKGYHDGTGTVVSESLDKHTPGDASAEDLIKNRTAWVNGDKITGTLELTGNATNDKVVEGFTFYKNDVKKKIVGTMHKNNSITKGINCGEDYTIPAGYHDGTSKIYGNSLESQTVSNASPKDLLYSKTAWVNGKLVTGTIPVFDTTKVRVSPNTNITLPAGYYPNPVIVYGITTENNKLDLTGTDAREDQAILYSKNMGTVIDNKLYVSETSIE